MNRILVITNGDSDFLQLLQANCDVTVKSLDAVFVDSNAFRGCTSLTIDLTPTLQKIEDCAFAFLYQNGEAVINFSGTIAEWNSIEKSDSWKTNSWFVDVNCTDGVLNLRGK